MPIQLCTVPDCYAFGKYCRLHSGVTIKPAQPIAKFSPKREEINRKQYGPAQKAFLKAHPFCQLKLKGCKKLSQGVHHVNGKETIEKLLDQSGWMAACNHCNGEVERRDAEARAAGLKGSKHTPNYKRTKSA